MALLPLLLLALARAAICWLHGRARAAAAGCCEARAEGLSGGKVTARLLQRCQHLQESGDRQRDVSVRAACWGSRLWL